MMLYWINSKILLVARTAAKAFRHSRAACAIAFVFSLFVFHPPASARTSDIALGHSIDAVRALQGAGAEHIRGIESNLLRLTYTQHRIFRALCHLRGIGAVDLSGLVELAATYSVPFIVIPLVEQAVKLPGATIADCRSLLDILAGLSFVQAQTMASLTDLKLARAGEVLRLAGKMQRLDDSGLWAAKALAVRPEITVAEVMAGLDVLTVLSLPQQRAAEKLFALAGPGNEQLPAMLRKLKTLSQSDAINFESLLSQPEINGREATFWLDQYFLAPAAGRQARFLRLVSPRKVVLLRAFAGAAAALSQRINNLHDITDRFGYEISAKTLAGCGPGEIQGLFLQLHEKAVAMFAPSFDGALRRHDLPGAVSILRQATSVARQAFAEELSAMNIYVLLARAAALYDSSFRDILVPVLRKRIAGPGGGDFLSFVQAVDPQQEYAADCVINLGRTGKLTGFLPANPLRQRQLIDLMIGSVVRDQSSLLLFSVAFSRLLPPLASESRTRLLDAMLAEAEKEKSLTARQMQVVLQWYLVHFPKLLSKKEKEDISALLVRRGAIDLAPYIAAPFAEWLADRNLTALSVFQQDDDGRQSYLTTSLALLENGYRPVLSPVYCSRGTGDRGQQDVEAAIRSIPGTPQRSLSGVFDQSCRTPLVVDWRKRVQGIELVQSIHVFHSRAVQEELLATFLSFRHEMFAQRGHSYWRDDQLFGPIESLLAGKRITVADFGAKQRLVCLGSCGGVRACTRLNQLFHGNVDLLATAGTGRTDINTQYNRRIFEIIATHPGLNSWRDIMACTAALFNGNDGGDYIQPGSLPAILYKMADRTDGQLIED